MCSPPIVTSQRLDRNVTAATNTRNNRRIVGPVVYSALRVVLKADRRVVLPRTSSLLNFVLQYAGIIRNVQQNLGETWSKWTCQFLVIADVNTVDETIDLSTRCQWGVWYRHGAGRTEYMLTSRHQNAGQNNLSLLKCVKFVIIGKSLAFLSPTWKHKD
jgi:hypothetical protein